MTLLELYILHAPTLDEPPLVEAVIARELSRQTKRRRDIVKLALRPEGEGGVRVLTYRQIGAILGISGGTVQSTLREAMDSIRKHALGLPRYHNAGRPKGRGYGRRIQKKEASGYASS